MLKVVVSKCFTNYTRLWKNKDLFICAFIVLAAFIAPQFEYFFPGGDSHIKWTGMLVGNFEFNP